MRPLIQERDLLYKKRGCSVVRQTDDDHDQTCCQNDLPMTSSSESDPEEDKNLRIIDEYGTEVCFDKISQRSLSPV